MIVTTKDLFQQAYGRYAVGAYNINNLEQTVGLFRGNLGQKNSNDEPVNPKLSAPFIIQLSRGARSYTDKRFLEAMIRAAEEIFADLLAHLPPGRRVKPKAKSKAKIKPQAQAGARTKSAARGKTSGRRPVQSGAR